MRVFVAALDWPGWCRGAKTEEDALAMLASYADRYARVPKEAGIAFDLDSATNFEVVERLPGNATTDYGAPGAVGEHDMAGTDEAEAARISSLVNAAWRVLDQVVATAPASLRKGPRGGGRDRDKMYAHVVDAEVYYARKLGLRLAQPAINDPAGIQSARKAVLSVLTSPSDGTPPVEKGWPPRYAARRIAWHVLDHAWEMEDRS